MPGDGLIKTTIGDLLDKVAEKFPNEDAAVFVDRGLRYSWRQLQEACNEVAKGFLALGTKRGDHIAIWATNHPEWVILQMACAKIGAVLVTINPACRSSELEYLLKQSDSKTIVLIENFKASNYVAMLRETCPELDNSQPGKLRSSKVPRLRNVILIGEKRFPGMFNWADIKEMGKKISFKKLAKRQRSLDPNDVTNIMYTSGTTGFPKGAMLTHFATINNAFCVAQKMHLTGEDRVCIPVPLYHAFGCNVGTLGSLAVGATMIFPSEYFDPRKTLEAIEKEKCTVIYGVPTMFIAELDHPDFERFDLRSLRTGTMAGAPCPIEVMRKVVDKMGARDITISYGLTETSPILTQTDVDDPLEIRVSTVGKILPNAEIKIVDPQTEEEVATGVQGELLARGIFVTKGYYKMPEATKKAIDKNKWFHTGDLGVVDKEGYYSITGRLKDMIIRGGENIYPREIEEFLYTHPKILDVQVVGVPSKKYGEEVAACIALKEGEVLTGEEVKKFCRGNIAYYKIPKYVEFTAEFPTTVTGKIQKFKLREYLIKKLGLEEES